MREGERERKKKKEKERERERERERDQSSTGIVAILMHLVCILQSGSRFGSVYEKTRTQLIR